jgi:hypothetical protein
VEIGWDDILQDDSSKGIFQMELENVDKIADYDEEDGAEVLSTLNNKLADIWFHLFIFLNEKNIADSWKCCTG